MSASEPSKTQETGLTQDLVHAARYYLTGRGGLIALAAVIVVAALVLNWSWLVAVGIAPLLVGVLPCLAMCALGLCANKMMGPSCSKETASRTSEEHATPRVRVGTNEHPVPVDAPAYASSTEQTMIAADPADETKPPRTMKERS
jgi:hypothetical protein